MNTDQDWGNNNICVYLCSSLFNKEQGKSVRSTCRIVIGVLLLWGSVGCGLRIVPTFTDSAGLTWTDERKAVVRRAIADFEGAIAEDETIAVEFKFFEAEPGLYGMWYAIDFP